jgi:HD superfamily phosphodiesterase
MKKVIPQEHKDRFFFHFTHIENLGSILKHGILCTNKKEKLKIEHFNVAANTIQERRSTMSVPCGPKGTVHDYVPFYFTAVNPMFLRLVNTKNVDQDLMLYFAVSIDKLLEKKCVFTDASANTAIPPTFFEDPVNLKKLDWAAIDSKKWKCADQDEMHRRMAEVLIHDTVTVDQIDYIIVWNERVIKEVEKIYSINKEKPPEFSYSPFKRKYPFHFTKFMVKGQEMESLVTGPVTLRQEFENTINNVIRERSKQTKGQKYAFKDIADALSKLKTNFRAIKELEGIYKLETKNDVHSETVSDHTLIVVANLDEIGYFKSLKKNNQNILKLSAYLHDIGKGPKTKWSDGKQPSYPDHPADAPKMLERILVEDFEKLSDYEIRKICLLVTYHDLIGEIIGKGRDIQQLKDIIKDETELEMLDTINEADIKAIDKSMWLINYQVSIRSIKVEVLDSIKK